MARRAGKAAARKSRQRRVQRPTSRPAATPVPPAASLAGPPASAAPEAVSLDQPRRPAPSSVGVGSTLSLRERAEYHYVERDLRNIGILTAVMAVLLVLAWIAFTATGLVG